MTDELKTRILQKMAEDKKQHYFFLNTGKDGKIQAKILNVSEDTRSFDVQLAGYPSDNGKFTFSFDAIVALPTIGPEE